MDGVIIIIIVFVLIAVLGAVLWMAYDKVKYVKNFKQLNEERSKTGQRPITKAEYKAEVDWQTRKKRDQPQKANRQPWAQEHEWDELYSKYMKLCTRAGEQAMARDQWKVECRTTAGAWVKNNLLEQKIGRQARGP